METIEHSDPDPTLPATATKTTAAATKIMGRALIILFGVVVASVMVAIIGNYHGAGPPREPSPTSTTAAPSIPASISDQVMSNIDGERIKSTLRMVTRQPHVAGTASNYEVGEKIAALWRSIGLSDVHFANYNVLLSYPNYSQPNSVAILNKVTGEEVWSSSGVSPVILPDEQGAQSAGVQWLAYSAGHAEGEFSQAQPVYCHYGTVEDFKRLAEMGIDVAGKIAIMRYNTDFRGDKVYNAQAAGAIAAILYSDPAECAREGTGPSNVYPNTVWMPPHGVQRGSIIHGLYNGDPLSPHYPARRELFGRSVEEARDSMLLPKIPAVPMSYGDAYEILSRMGGLEAPADWQGALNFTYHIGPGFLASPAEGRNETQENELAMHVNSENVRRDIRDIIGYIPGSEFPDEYVILGNHYDAWVYGAIDPNSGTAVLAEVARAMMKTANETGWRPKRTVMFCNWDAEEYSLIGSTEFVEEFASQLHDRAVVYLNLDLLSNNQSLDSRTVPTLYQAVVNAAKAVPNPLESEKQSGRSSVYDSWLHYFPPTVDWLPDYPEMKVPGGGSDHVAFLNYVGVPILDFTYRNASWRSYPLYHTLYETPYVNEHLFDTNNFAVHKASGQFWAQMALAFADADILPLNVTVLARRLREDYVPDLKKAMGPLNRTGDSSTPGAANDGELQPAKQQLSNLIKKCHEFVEAARAFEANYMRGDTSRSSQPSRSRRLSSSAINARLKAVDRCFINPRGIQTGVPIKRHVLFSLSDKDSYQPTVMSAVYDQLDNFKHATGQKQREEYGKAVAREISAVQFCVQCAINEMQPFI